MIEMIIATYLLIGILLNFTEFLQIGENETVAHRFIGVVLWFPVVLLGFLLGLEGFNYNKKGDRNE